jgi:hypothetical protein
LLEARTCLAELLVKIAGELLEDSIPRSTAQLITDTRDTVVHAQALIDAIDRKLERMQKAARAIRAMYRQRATGRGRARDRQP